jgi:hypothetical protein
MKYQLIHTFGNVIIEGTKEECELGLKALTTYDPNLESKFEIEEAVPVYVIETSNEIAEEVAAFIEANNMRITHIFETSFRTDSSCDAIEILDKFGSGQIKISKK